MGDPRTYLTALLARPGAVHLAAQDASGRLVALGHLMPDGGSAEVALLVEDELQNSGLGTRLLLHLAHHAVRGGWEEIYGLLLPGDERISAILRHVAVEVHSREDGGVTLTWAKTSDLAASLPSTRRPMGVRTMRWGLPTDGQLLHRRRTPTTGSCCAEQRISEGIPH
ncbi:N-acetyltransferase [Streptomyces sp. NPDC059582]|uniref:N-acetyltransferase n=1 Tax=Streptomyces sp. NPDC059582 TaxID=3346875 RepID=UPI00369A4F93